ncbi:MAG TPA: sugar ABC transporter ATP-binding protein [Candidatus Limnocylindrales bacterium]|nr:sugar ABC transporter ATP-binding protein [Candidatus Limnocylindrales bacterium]
MTPVLEIHDITKTFFGVPAVRNVTLSLDSGAVLGLIGQNGAGKSTLVNMVGGVVQPDGGSLTFKGAPYAPRTPADAYRAGISFIHQELNLFTNLSIAENIFIEAFPARGRGPFKVVDRKEVRQRTKNVLASVGLDLSPDLLVERISPGERQLVEIAKALYQDAALIIFDEPTTSLTARETERLFGLMKQLREQGKAIVYISHILADVLKLSDSIAVMRDGLLVAHEPASTFNVHSMITLMVGRNIEQLFPQRTATPEATPLLSVQGLTEPGIVQDISLTLHKGEVLGLFGLMGSGRTELARMLFGLDTSSQGTMQINGAAVKKPSPRRSIRSKVAFVTENRREEGLLMNINIGDNIALASLPTFSRTPVQVIDQKSLLDSARHVSSLLQLKSGDINQQPAKSLSGGNQQKVVIAKWLLSEPSAFIMDEPTRGVDVGAKFEIYTIIDQLAAAGQGILFISSELEELTAMCDRILVMSRGEIVGEFSRAQFSEEAILHAAFREGAAAS